MGAGSSMVTGGSCLLFLALEAIPLEHPKEEEKETKIMVITDTAESVSSSSPVTEPEPQPEDSPSSGATSTVDCRPESAPPLPAQARIAARKGDANGLHIFTTSLKRSISGLDEEGRTLLFHAVGCRDDDPEEPQSLGHLSSLVARARRLRSALRLDSKSARSKRTTMSGQLGETSDMVRYLVETHEADLNFQVKACGTTPLMEAVRFGNLRAVKTLLELGADISLRNTRGQTALDIANTKLPEYITFPYSAQGRKDAVAGRINQDRLQAVKLLQNAGR
eukprot:TRINITY_DN91937_c0_g1_i1.p1 TRINITY_DN91937_c0_g1~~TRINITY_DN91937_c0_g1_i1.p1  ORF type:complete len:279 (+),score=47.02 TRINITY_DN91937_c0_g1_i1:50-886(+)